MTYVLKVRPCDRTRPHRRHSWWSVKDHRYFTCHGR